MNNIKQLHGKYMFKLQQKVKGFTIIELVVVITILGILAAIALPRFSSLQADARVAKMNGALGAVKSSAVMSHALLIARGFDTNFTGTPSPAIVVEGTNVTYTNGYPDAASVIALAGLGASDYVISGLTAPVIATSDSNHTTCGISYSAPAGANLGPTYSLGATLANCS